MTWCEACRTRPGVLWRAVRSPEGWTVTRVLCPECAGLRPRPKPRWRRALVHELGWALFIVLGALAAAPVVLYAWAALR